MSRGENSEIQENEFSLSELLVPATAEEKAIKSLQGNEYEYGDYLGTIEYSIARYFYEDNREIKDKDTVSALKNIRNNCDKKISFFEQDLEKEIIENLLDLLESEPISHHEFELAIDYVLEVIDNRSWMEDEQAYLKWVTYVMGLFTEEESEEYEKSVKKLAAKLGLSSKHADLMLLKGSENDYFEFVENYGTDDGDNDGEELTEEELIDKMERKFLSLPDAEKFDFLMEKGTDYMELMQDYLLDLMDKEDFDRIQEFYKKFNEKHRNFSPLQIMVGNVYAEKDPDLAKSYFDEALRSVQESKEFPEEIKKELMSQINYLTSLLFEESAEIVEEKASEGKKGKKTSKSGRKTLKKDSESKTGN